MVRRRSWAIRVCALVGVTAAAIASNAGEPAWSVAGSEASGASTSASTSAEAASPAVDESWAIRGQATLVPQGNLRFRSPFQGANSLNAKGQARETFDFTLYAGARLWSGAEIWVNPEVDQGFGEKHSVFQ